MAANVTDVIPAGMTLIASGYRDQGEGSGISWWVFKKSTQKQAVEFINANELFRRYGGPGQPYENQGTYRSSLSYTLIEQRGGLDI